MHAESTLALPLLEVALSELSIEIGAGRLCLDFANTADWHAAATPIELLPTYTHLLAWADRVDVVDHATIVELDRLSRQRPDQAEAVRQRAIALREAIYGIFSARHRGKTVQPADFDVVNHELQLAFDHLIVRGPMTPYVWEWRDTTRQLDAPLWPVARSMAELLTSPEVERVHECAGDPCGWLFLDTSRNRSRRWCSMESCGNRAKARRHYERTRASVQAS